MEYRGWITLPAVDIEGDDAGRLLGRLEHDHGDLGPVLSSTTDGLQVILATDAPDEAAAAGEFAHVVADVHAGGLGDPYPTALESSPPVRTRPSPGS